MTANWQLRLTTKDQRNDICDILAVFSSRIHEKSALKSLQQQQQQKPGFRDDEEYLDV